MSEEVCAVVCRPLKDEGPRGENRSGIGLYLVFPDALRRPGEDEEVELSAVASRRDASRNPELSFEDALARESEKAQRVADAVNDGLDAYYRARAAAIEDARAVVAEVFEHRKRATVPE